MTEFRAAIWAAVSSKPQYRNDSTTSQIEDARAEIRRRGWSESRLYEVPGHTRAYITLMELLADPDPELDAYRQYVADCRESAARVAKSLPPTFNVVICRARDRLGRTDAVIADMEAYARHAGAAVFSSAFPTDPEIASEGRDTWVSAIERAGAQEDNRRRRDLSERGKLVHAKRGRVPTGLPPFGYRRLHLLTAEDYQYVTEPLDDKQPMDLVVYDPEAVVVRLIFTWYAEFVPIRGIARRLNDAGARAPNMRWYPAIVSDVLSNPLYAGRIVYGREQFFHVNGGRSCRKRAAPLVATDGCHTAIVSAALFDEVQQLRKTKAELHGRAAGSTHLFSGLVRCRCGYRMKRRGQRATYYCPGVTLDCARPCDNRRGIRESALRTIILTECQARADSRAMFDAWRDGTQADSTDQTRAMYDQALAENAAAVQRWNTLYEKGRLDEEEWLDHRQRLQDERERIEGELALLGNVEQRHAILPTYDEWCAAIKSSDDIRLRRVLVRCMRYIEWDGEAIAIHWR